MANPIPRIPSKFLLFFVVLTMLVVPALADTNVYWTPYFNYDGSINTGGIDFSHYNISTSLASTFVPNTTPWEMFWASGLLALGLFLLSLRARTVPMELEIDAIVSVLAWVPAGFCAFAAFNIDRVVGYGVTSQVFNTTTQAQIAFNNHEYVYMEHHLIYSEPLIGILMIVFTLVCVANTFRIVAQHRALKLQLEKSE